MCLRESLFFFLARAGAICRSVVGKATAVDVVYLLCSVFNMSPASNIETSVKTKLTDDLQEWAWSCSVELVC